MNFVFAVYFLNPARSRFPLFFTGILRGHAYSTVVVLSSRYHGRASAGPGAGLPFFPRQKRLDPNTRALVSRQVPAAKALAAGLVDHVLDANAPDLVEAAASFARGRLPQVAGGLTALRTGGRLLKVNKLAVALRLLFLFSFLLLSKNVVSLTTAVVLLAIAIARPLSQYENGPPRGSRAGGLVWLQGQRELRHCRVG